jgi:hypothetical protein
MVIKQINKSEILAIHNFLMSAIYDFKAMNCQSDELIISMPNWLQELLRWRPMIKYLDYNELMSLEYFKYANIKTQPHYIDEVVVFFKDYHLNPEKLTPRIYEIKTTES